jgi:hypothetical protein
MSSDPRGSWSPTREPDRAGHRDPALRRGDHRCGGMRPVRRPLSKPLGGHGDRGWDHLAAYAIERGVIWAIVGALVVAAAARLAASDCRSVKRSSGRAPACPAARRVGRLHRAQAFRWRDQAGRPLAPAARLHALPGVPLAILLARAAGTRAVECALAALAGAVLAVLLSGGDRTVIVTLQVVPRRCRHRRGAHPASRSRGPPNARLARYRWHLTARRGRLADGVHEAGAIGEGDGLDAVT